MQPTTDSELREIHFSGHVQGVGFRATTRQLARGLAVCGYVMNLSDGRVRLMAEGTKAELDRLERLIGEHLGPNIHDTTRDVRPATGQFGGFEIRY